MAFGLVMLIVGAVMAVRPIPSAVVTITPYLEDYVGGEIQRSKVIPTSIKLFEDENEGIRSTVAYTDHGFRLCQLDVNDQEFIGNLCISPLVLEYTQVKKNLDYIPFVEIRGACAASYMSGFLAKLDNGEILTVGNSNLNIVTAWEVLGGPIIGLHHTKSSYIRGGVGELGFVIGDECRPKYLLSQTLILILGEERGLKFYWQDSYEEYFGACLKKGLFAIQNPNQLKWIKIDRNYAEVKVLTPAETLYTTSFTLQVSYGKNINYIYLDIVKTYSIPSPDPFLSQPLRKTEFSDMRQEWVVNRSTFIFCDSFMTSTYEYGNIFLAGFQYVAVKGVEYVTQQMRCQQSPKTSSNLFFPQTIDNAVVTEMKLFYQQIEWSYESKTFQERVIVGIQFKDHSKQLVSCNYERRINFSLEKPIQYLSVVCGTEGQDASRWISLGGPFKGSYLIIVGKDEKNEYVSDFGLRVDDPCKAHDDSKNIIFSAEQTIVKDLKFHAGTDSDYWLNHECQNQKALKLTEAQMMPFVSLISGNLRVRSIPPDLCTRLEVQHQAPDASTFTNVLYLHILTKQSAMVEDCTPQEGSCYPNIDGLALASIAGQRKTYVLFKQASVGKYFSACADALFELTEGPAWLLLADSSSLVVDAPNDVNAVGEFRFFLNIWEMSLSILAPCNSTYIQGQQEQGHVSLYVDELVDLVVKFEADDKGQSWAKVCGSIQRALIFNAPEFIKYIEKDFKIQIKPQNKRDKGLHKILLELVIKSQKSFHVLEILVKLPISYIDSNLKPFFCPALKNQKKQYGKRWRESLSSICDPVEKYAYVSRSRISPRRASEFVKVIFSSDAVTNATRILFIDEDDWSEKTGNVSVFVDISAFNQNYSVWQGQNQNTRSQDWRWRISEHRFNLTVLHHSKYVLARRKSGILCLNGRKQTLTTREYCYSIFDKNITIDHLGQIAILLGDYFSFPENFVNLFNDGDSELKSIFQISLVANPFHKLNHKIEMVSQTNSKIIEIEKGKTIKERSVKELVGLSFKQFKNSNRYQTKIKKTSHTFVFQITFENPWQISGKQNDILKIKICNQKFFTNFTRFVNSEGCLELFQNVPPQNYETEYTIIAAITVFVMIAMVILLANHIKDLLTKSRVFPFISLILTPIIIMHVFTVDVKLAEVVKFLMKRLFQILTYDFLGVKSRIDTKELERPSLSIAGYYQFSQISNMGIVYWLMLIFIVFLMVKLVLYIFKEKVDIIPKGQKASKYISTFKKGFESLYNYLSVHHIISVSSMTIYLWYEYVEKGCFELKCLVSNTSVSGTKLVKLQIVVAVILLIGQSVHFCRILVLLHRYRWFSVKDELKKQRISYQQKHQRFMRCGFGSGYDFEMKRLGLNKGKYFMIKLEDFEDRLDLEEDRLNELHRYLGSQYCHGLEPSLVGYKRCVVHLLLDQARTYLIVLIIVLFGDKIFQLVSIFVLQNVYFVIQLTWVRAGSQEVRMAGWIDFAVCMAVNYYQLITLVEFNQKVLNFSGWATNIIIFMLMVFTLGFPSLKCFKQLLMYIKQNHFNKNSGKNQACHVQINMPRKELQIVQLEDQKTKTEFLNGIVNRGFTPVDNLGGGNCVFISLAELVFGDANRFELMRYMIVHRLRSFPEKYFKNTTEFPNYCNNMLIPGKPASQKEIQAASDIFFAVIECYSTQDPTAPANTIWPLRLSTVSPEHINTLRIWTQGTHCVALVDNKSHPLVINIFEVDGNELKKGESGFVESGKVSKLGCKHVGYK